MHLLVVKEIVRVLLFCKSLISHFVVAWGKNLPTNYQIGMFLSDRLSVHLFVFFYPSAILCPQTVSIPPILHNIQLGLLISLERSQHFDLHCNCVQCTVTYYVFCDTAGVVRHQEGMRE